MKRRPLGAALLALWWAWSWSPVLGQPRKDLPQINRQGWTSSSVCGECHQAIHAVWRQSLHSNSWSNGVFQAAYRRTLDRYGASQGRTCLSCHAPTVRHTKDFEVRKPITTEGITCDFCHSIRDVKLADAGDPIRLTVGDVKYGPLRHAQSPAHQVVHSELHQRSELCGACHEYRNAQGLTILGTYSEWKASPYAQRGKQCQDCHMPLVPGRVVALEVKDQALGSVNLHNISGSHDLERVRKAITLKLDSTDWFGDRVWVNLEVANMGSGHCFPTGLPMHRAVLEVTLHEGNREVGRREIPFQVVMVDENGQQMRHEYELFARAAKVQIDTRLKPLEVRPIEVAFRDVEGTRLSLRARLSYQYSTETLVTEQDEQRIEPVEMKFLLASVQKTLKRPTR